MSKRKERQKSGLSAMGEVKSLQDVDKDIYGFPESGTKAEIQSVLSSGELRTGAFLWTPVGLQIDGELTQKDWEETGRVLRRIDVSLQWLIGDWVNYGVQWGETGDFAANLDFSIKTLYEYAYVSKNVEFSIRMENLSFGHHQAVASLSTEEQKTWLQQAVDNEWSVAKLREAISGKKSKKSQFDKVFNQLTSIRASVAKISNPERLQLRQLLEELLQELED